jgi:hypothetical protein
MAAGLALATALLGCGGSRPHRYVIEEDLGAFAYRRYQKTLGVEITIPENRAVGHTATYLRRSGSERVAVATAFVTVYEHARSLSAEVAERVQPLARYRVSVAERSGGHAFLLDAGPSERWLVWVSGRHVVKLGAPAGEDFPEAVVDAYMSEYPSDLDEHGRALPDTQSRGPSRKQKEEQASGEPDVPRFLRENSPK